MNINWKVRVKSGPFWLGVASAVIMAVFYILDLCGVAPEITGSQIVDAVRLVLMIPAAIGIISDPTTKGIPDSALAMSYDKPKDDRKNNSN